tara:strand:- start:72 stop:377 length:306 start_codon:yes stop_codon:yes gene_type:complete
MQFIESFDEEQAVHFCAYCGTKNVELNPAEVEVNQCFHFEGFWTDDGIEYDKNGIIENAVGDTINNLKKQLDDSYVVFSFGGMGPTIYCLYHFVQEENENE